MLNALYLLAGVAALAVGFTFYGVGPWLVLFWMKGLLIVGSAALFHSLLRFYFIYRGWDPAKAPDS